MKTTPNHISKTNWATFKKRTSSRPNEYISSCVKQTAFGLCAAFEKKVRRLAEKSDLLPICFASYAVEGVGAENSDTTPVRSATPQPLGVVDALRVRILSSENRFRYSGTRTRTKNSSGNAEIFFKKINSRLKRHRLSLG